MKETQHGDIVLVSDESPECRVVVRGSLEILDPDRRKMAAEGLTLLWKAMQLTEGASLVPGRPTHQMNAVYCAMYRQIGLILLGNDYPEFEVWT